MTLFTEPYLDQLKRWPASGRHILAQFDASKVVVYQAYHPAIGRFAVQHQRFGGPFSFNRMSWIKPNFLWMMYRCGWGTKSGQEVVLAVHLRREGFNEILRSAVYSSYQPDIYGSPERWKAELAASPVRLQWDPDHDPQGGKVERRAIQLGLSGEILRRYAEEWILKIEDISEFISCQREHCASVGHSALVTPREDVYPVSNPEVATRLRID
jgi:hypothetical protein